MPIVDGLTSTKLIRSYEKSHPEHNLSPRASLNGRIPIIAVSASLVEKERQTYIDAGFCGWILKPIDFNRLTEMMKGITDQDIRKANLYRPGRWEYGGWFHEANPRHNPDTTPDQQPPQHTVAAAPPSMGMQIAAATDDPFVKEDENSKQTMEQQRLARAQEDYIEAPKASSMPELSRGGISSKDSSEETLTPERFVKSPPPMTPESSDAEQR